jgi:dolichol-phosphate mannosyltransferase
MNSPASTLDCTIVVPVYFNEGQLSTTLQIIREKVVQANPGRTFEVIFVDDGSGDGSLIELRQLHTQFPRLVKIIKLSRNFGQVAAIRCGYAHAAGACVVAMSADGQDPAELINEMLTSHFEEGYDVVIAARQGRDESAYRIWTSALFYRIIQRLCFPAMPLGGFDFTLMSRRAVEVFLAQREAHPFYQGQILWMGFKTKQLNYRRLERKIGASRWTFGKKLTYLIDGVVSYSFFPIRLVSFLGILTALAGFAYAVVVLIVRLKWGTPVQGWAPLMIVMLVLGGLQMLTFGVFGEYLWRIFAQVQNRAPYIVEQVYEQKEPGNDPA